MLKSINIKKHYNHIIFTAFLIVFLFMTIGYSALSSELLVQSEVSIRPYKDIRITNIKNDTFLNEGYELFNPKYTSDTITTSIKLPNLNSSVTYSVSITNNVSNNMKLTNIINETVSNDSIVYQLNGLSINDTILGASTVNFSITFKYKEGIELPSDTSSSNIIKFVFEPLTSKKYQETILNGSYPKFEEGLLAITIDDDGTVKLADLNEEWYSYANKRWANSVVTVNYEKYKNASPGTVIEEADIVAYFVWIPRYAYKPFSSDKEEVIEIKFFNKESSAPEGYKVPEAFRVYRNGVYEELSGYWINKFQVSKTDEVLKSVPDNEVLRSVSFKSFHELGIENNKNYLFNNSDSILHVVKNSEWGATAYLGNSIYGFCTSESCNPPAKNSTFTAGKYNDKNDYKSALGLTTSTTQNIYGVYDMVGCTQEMTMGTNSIANLNIPGLEPFYYDDYTSTEYYNGDATVETKNWYGKTIPTLGTAYNQRIFIRGGNRYEGSAHIFYVKTDSGSGGANNGTRYVLSMMFDNKTT